MNSWIGSTIQEIDVRRKFHINILTIKNGTNIMAVPKADYTFKKNDLIIVLGKSADVLRLATQI